jgi:hypothetical protein
MYDWYAAACAGVDRIVAPLMFVRGAFLLTR